MNGPGKKDRSLYDALLEFFLLCYAATVPVSLSAANVSLALVIATGLSKLYIEGKRVVTFPLKLLAALFTILFLWVAATALISNGYIVRKDISNIWEYLPILLFPLFIHATKVSRERTIFVLLFFSSLVCILGIAQYLYPSITYPFPRQLVTGREFKGFFSHHLHTGGFFSITTILAFSLILFWRCDRKVKLLLWIFFLLNLTAVMLSMARSYYVSLLMVMPVLLLLKNRRWFLGGSLAIIVLLVAILASPNPVNSRIKTLFDLDFGSNKERIYMWKTAIRMFADHPLSGVGKGNWEKVARKKYFPRFNNEWRFSKSAHAPAHNPFLTPLPETAIIGLLLFLAFWLFVAWTLLTDIRRISTGFFDRALAVGALAALGNLFVAGMFENNFGTSIILLLISLLVGLSLSTEKVPSEAEV